MEPKLLEITEEAWIVKEEHDIDEFIPMEEDLRESNTLKSEANLPVWPLSYSKSSCSYDSGIVMEKDSEHDKLIRDSINERHFLEKNSRIEESDYLRKIEESRFPIVLLHPLIRPNPDTEIGFRKRNIPGHFTDVVNDEDQDVSETISQDKKMNQRAFGEMFCCEMCDFKSKRKISLINHMKTHSNMLKCSECTYQSKYVTHFKIHLLRHSNNKIFKCSECKYDCYRKWDLKKHMLKHLNQKLLQCTECDFQTSRKDQFRNHILSHSNRKLLKCSQCNYECKRRNDYNRHVLTHSNKKLYNCSECSYGSNRKYQLRAHLLRHSDKKLLKCAICDYECNRKFQLKLHLLSHSKGKLFQCSECDYECNEKYVLKIHMLTHSNKRKVNQNKRVKKK